MAYATTNRVPFFSSTRVPSPIVGGAIGGPRFANNEAVFAVTAPEAAFFDQHRPSSPPVDVTVNSDAANIYFSWPALPLVRGTLEIYYMRDARFSKDLSELPRGEGEYLEGPYVGNPSTGVTVARPGEVDPGSGFFAFFVCLAHNGMLVCSEPAVQGGQTWTTVAKPADLRVIPFARVDNLVSVLWDDVADTEDGYKVQVRAGSGPWREPGLTVEPSAHLVRRNESRAYLWDLDRVGTGREDVLHFRVCAVRRWAEDACSETVSLERREVGGGPEAILGFDPSSVRVNEGDQARLTVRLSEAVSSDVTLAWSTVDGLATGGADYTAGSGTLTIAAGRTTAGLTVRTLTDRVVEGDETFEVTISAGSSSRLPGGVTLGATTATVTIVDQTPRTAAAPTRLRVLGDTTSLGSVKLAWDDNSSNETGFVIRGQILGVVGGVPVWVTPVEVHRGPNTTSATVSGLTANKYYVFSVRALTGQVESDRSNSLYARSTSRPNYGESTDCGLNRWLALLGPRNEYGVRMCWQTPSGVETDALDFDLAARDSGLLYFLERDNAEVLLKVLDFCSFNGYRWVFVAPVTTLAYRLSVTGPGARSHTFSNRAGRTAGSRIHKAAFPCSGSSAAAVESGPGPMPAGGSLPRAAGLAPDAAPDRSVVDALLPTSDGLASVTAASAPSCTLRSTGLTLAGGYRVDACWQSGDGRSGAAVDWRLPSSQSGILYFFERDNAEVLVKVLDGCGVNNRRWVFVAPVTDLGLRLRVTAPDGTRWDYENRVGSVAVPRSDTNAFVCR